MVLTNTHIMYDLPRKVNHSTETLPNIKQPSKPSELVMSNGKVIWQRTRRV